LLSAGLQQQEASEGVPMSEIAKLRHALEEVQWLGGDGDCPYCGFGKHTEKCVVGNALATTSTDPQQVEGVGRTVKSEYWQRKIVETCEKLEAIPVGLHDRTERHLWIEYLVRDALATPPVAPQVEALREQVMQFLRDLSNATTYRSHDLGYEDSITMNWKEDAKDLLAALAASEKAGKP
jgi:hypothetical protein